MPPFSSHWRRELEFRSVHFKPLLSRAYVEPIVDGRSRVYDRISSLYVISPPRPTQLSTLAQQDEQGNGYVPTPLARQTRLVMAPAVV